jgi:predicted enzyme related to lactoylglutathione lyase
MNKNLFGAISYLNLYSKNNKALIAFYRDVLGISPLPGQSEDQNWYGLQTKGVTVAIEPEENRQGFGFVYNQNNPILIQFKANDEAQLEAMNQQLEKMGIALLRRSEEKSYGTVTNFLDPDGNLLEILLEKKS